MRYSGFHELVALRLEPEPIIEGNGPVLGMEVDFVDPEFRRPHNQGAKDGGTDPDAPPWAQYRHATDFARRLQSAGADHVTI
jgi:hypothetical protein